MFKLNKILSKFVVKYRILFKDILTFLGLDYRDSSLIIVDLVVIGISTPKINRIIISHINLLLKKLKINMFKMDLRTFW